MTELAESMPDAASAAVKRLANGFCHAKLLLAAEELGVFAHLHRYGPSAGEDLVEGLPLHPRGARDLLHGLVLLGLLEQRDGRYANSAAATAALVPGGADYVGGFLRRADRMLYPAWQHLAEALVSGKPQTPGAGPEAFRAMLGDPRQREQYLRMMDSANGRVAGHLAGAFDWAAHGHVADIGGCRGNLVGQLLRLHSTLRATVFDLPELAESFAEHATALGVADRADFRAGDFFTDPLPEADVLILGHVLHNWSVEQRKFLVAKAYGAVRPGGALLIYDAMLDEEPTDLARVLVSLNMLLVTEEGSEYTAGEATAWLGAAGCGDVRVAPLGPADTLVVGRKPAA
ncbi:methyltransferase [Streptomyces sp. NPDC007971]|uniref:methyltransferase n=1 Tax=Streptomyces sp. NPDC007971 TaxID=3364799 RepID=UPI0036EA46F9